MVISEYNMTYKKKEYNSMEVPKRPMLEIWIRIRTIKMIS
jgi:hypothetical protein